MFRKINLVVVLLAMLLVTATIASSQTQSSGCNCANASLVGDAVGTRFNLGPGPIIKVVEPGVELPGAGPSLGSPGPSPRWNIDLGSNTIRIDFMQQPATYGMGSYFTFSSLDPQLAGCPPAFVSGITVTTNKPSNQFNVVSAATFSPHTVTIQIAPSNRNLDWQPGEFVLVKLNFGCETPSTQTAIWAAGTQTAIFAPAPASMIANLNNLQAAINERSVVGNEDNPHDQVGVKHNQILSAFFRSDEYRSFRESKNRNPVEAVTAFFSKCCATQISCCTGNPPPPGMLKPGRSSAEILSKARVSRSVMQYASQVEATIKRLPKTTAHTRSSYQPFFALEGAILKDKNLGPEDRATALTIVAGAKYSAYFWNREVITTPKDGAAVGLRKIDWDRLLGVDAMGCIGGPEAGAAASIIDYCFQLSGN